MTDDDIMRTIEQGFDEMRRMYGRYGNGWTTMGVTPYYVSTVLSMPRKAVYAALARLQRAGQIVTINQGIAGFGWVQPVAMPTMRRVNV
jgi:hypothetical protein